MRYQSSSAIAYFFRNFWRYIYIVLPVAVFMAFFANFSSESAFLTDWANGRLVGADYVGAMMKGMLLLNQPSDWWYGIITYLLIAVTFSILVVKMSRHMRVGSFVVLPLKSAMKVMPPMLIFCACFAAFALALQFVAIGIVYLLSKLLQMQAVIIIGLVLLWLAKVAVVYVWMLMLCCFPLHYSENYPFNVALSYSIREMSKRPWTCIGNALLYATIQSTVVVCDYLIPVPAVCKILYGLFFAFVIYYVPCLAFTIHHQTLGSERKDVARVIIG